MEPNILDYPNSQEGTDAYEADLAEYNRIQKGPMIGTKFVDTVEDVVESGVEQILKVPILRTGLQFLGGAVTTIDQVMSEDQGPGGMVYRTYKNVKEASEEGFGDLAENLGVDRRIGEFGGGEVVDLVATAGVGTVAKRAKNVIDKLPPGGMSSQLATAGVAPMGLAPSTSKGSISLRPQVMEAASTLPTPTNWQNKARQLYGNQSHKELADTFRKGLGGKLSKKNTFINADELALNKGGVLDQMLERADRMAELRTKWNKQGKQIKGDRQRELYDAASLNPNISDIEMYSSTSARNYITKFTNILSKDQWHHVFGNKEAGEFILSIANSDPLVAANLFKKMENLGLNSSGIASNIAILKESKHTNWHNFIKDMGFEPKSPGKELSTKGSTAPGDFADLSQELGRAIVSGDADINDAFKLIELYAKYNEWMKTQITSKKFGGKLISDLPEGVGKAVQIGGYRKRPPKSTYKPLPEL